MLLRCGGTTTFAWRMKNYFLRGAAILKRRGTSYSRWKVAASIGHIGFQVTRLSSFPSAFASTNTILTINHDKNLPPLLRAEENYFRKCNQHGAARQQQTTLAVKGPTVEFRRPKCTTRSLWTISNVNSPVQLFPYPIRPAIFPAGLIAQLNQRTRFPSNNNKNLIPLNI